MGEISQARKYVQNITLIYTELKPTWNMTVLAILKNYKIIFNIILLTSIEFYVVTILIVLYYSVKDYRFPKQGLLLCFKPCL